jgi:hypothetical protein
MEYFILLIVNGGTMKHYIKIAIFATVILAGSTALHAAGVGGYFTTHVGSYTWKVGESLTLSDSTFGGIKEPPRGTPVILGGGIVWDTCLGKDELFNFRQNIGFDTHLKSTVNLNQVGLINTFGFAPVRTGIVRFWLGPQINLHYRWGKDAHDYYAASIFTMIDPRAIMGIRRKYEFVTIGTGLALGLNLNVHKNVTIALEAGMQIATSLWGKANDMDRIEASCWGYEGYATVSVLGRFNE